MDSHKTIYVGNNFISLSVGEVDLKVELDKRGRLVIPAEIREELPSRTLILRKLEDRIELIPLPDPRSLKGKYPIEGSLEEIEELQEKRLLERG